MQLSVVLWKTRLQRSALAALVVAAMSSAGAAAAPPAAPTILADRLTGSVTVSGGGPAAGARVVALQDAHPQFAAVDASGAYTLTFSPVTFPTGGTWAVSVAPPPPSTTSPNWVYTGGPQSVTFAGNPATPPGQTLNFVAAAAAGLITGTVLPPSGPINFNAPNRVWVRAENQEGQGNTVQVDPATGNFSINVLTGTVTLHLALENPDWSAPTTLAGSSWVVDVGTILPGPVGTLQLIEKSDKINGVVYDQTNNPVTSEAIPVRAWRLDGSEFVETRTNPLDGSYVLPVISGTWEIRAVPPLTSTYVTAESPQTVVFLTDHQTRVRNLRVAKADVTVNGSIVSSTSPSTILNIDNGRAFAQYRDDAGDWPQLGPTVPISGGQFTLKLSTFVSNHYRLRAYLPPDTGYTIDASPFFTVTTGGVYAISIPAAADNATISGHFDNHNTGLPQLGLPGVVGANSSSGGWTFDRLDPLTGGYSLAVAGTPNNGSGGTYWLLHGFVDPTTGYVVQHPRYQKVFVPAAGGNETVNFTVAQLDGAIFGRVTDLVGTPVAGARVSAREVSPPAGDDAGFDRWTISGPLGFYFMRVTAGTYRVRADPPPDDRDDGLLASVPQIVTVPSGGSAKADLKLRRRNATLAGTVSYNGTGHPAFVRAYSDSGAHAEALTGPNGGYLLHVLAGDTWHVQAVSEDTVVSGSVTVTVFLKSPRLIITPTVGLNLGVNLVMTQSGTLPDALAFAFDGSEAQDFTLSDGAEVVIPAGALVPSGQVRLLVRPLPELADTGGAQPVSFGYRLQAFDSSGVPITHFNSDVTLAVPFTAAQLAALGVTPDQLVPSYWDVATDSWKPVDNVTVQTQPSGNGTVFIQVDHFTDFALTTAPAVYQLFAPLVMR
jgi:hypothetical protein